MTTQTAPRTNGHPVTVRVGRPGSDPRACATENTPEPQIDTRSGLYSMCTRAISRFRRIRKDQPATSGGHVLQRHVEAAVAAMEVSAPVAEPLPPLAGAAREVFPARGEAGNALSWVVMVFAGVCRLAGVAAGTLIVYAVAGEPRPDGTRTRIRAGVFGVLTVLAVAVHLVLRGR